MRLDADADADAADDGVAVTWTSSPLTPVWIAESCSGSPHGEPRPSAATRAGEAGTTLRRRATPTVVVLTAEGECALVRLPPV
jgi:hypothetical protein